MLMRREVGFLFAYARLDQSLCWSVGPSVRPSVILLKFSLKNYLNCITAPAYPYATDAVLYTALFLENVSSQ